MDDEDSGNMTRRPDSGRWHIIGNGPGTPTIIPGEVVIGFNGKIFEGVDCTTWVFNRKVSGCCSEFHVKGGVPLENFTEVLTKSDEMLRCELGTKPSTGLTVIWTLKESIPDMRISCMNLLPSIARSLDLLHREPMTCHFHNWLGERRIILPFASSLDWPGLLLSDDNNGVYRFEDPFGMLKRLPSLERVEGEALIRELEGVTLDSWCQAADANSLTDVEPLFFLDRNDRETGNWWLFDQNASACMAVIHRKLAIAQQGIFLWG